MKEAVKPNSISPLNIVIDFFAFLYDSVYGFFNLLMESSVKSVSNIKKRPLDILIDFFAFLYDQVYDFITKLIVFFAFQYDLVSDFIQFLKEYVKWITDIHPHKSNEFTTQAEKII